MNNKHFDAILAKNNIARIIRDLDTEGMVPVNSLVFQLQEIENYIGEGNQPCVKDIVEDERKWL